MPDDDRHRRHEERLDALQATVSELGTMVARSTTRLDVVETIIERIGESVTAHHAEDREEVERARAEARMGHEDVRAKLNALRGEAATMTTVMRHEERLRIVEEGQTRIDERMKSNLRIATLTIPLVTVVLGAVVAIVLRKFGG